MDTWRFKTPTGFGIQQVGGCYRTWWRHNMEKLSVLLALCESNPSVTGGLPHTRPAMRSFDVSNDVCLNITVEDTFEILVNSDALTLIWRHCNAVALLSLLNIWYWLENLGFILYLLRCYRHSIIYFIMTSSNGKKIRVTGSLWMEFSGHRRIPLTKASDAELWFFFFDLRPNKRLKNNRDAGDLKHDCAH